MNQVERFSKIIAEKRKEKNLTQKMLAEQLGVSPQAVSKWENGLGMPDVALFPLLANALELSLDELFGVEKQPKEEYTAQKESESVEVAPTAESEIPICKIEEIGQKARRQGFFRRFSKEFLDLAAHCENVHSLYLSLARTCKVRVLQGEEKICRLVFHANSDFLEATTVTCENGLLKIRVKKKQAKRESEPNLLTIFVPFEKGELLHLSLYEFSSAEILPSFEVGELRLSGSGKMEVSSFAKELSASISGSGDMIGADSLGKTTLRVSGSGNMRLGTVLEPEIKCSGSGNIRCVSARNNIRVRISGSGDVKLCEVQGEMNVKLSGSGNCKCAGKLDSLMFDCSGCGKFLGSELTVGDAMLFASGCCTIKIGEIQGKLLKKVNGTSSLKLGKS